MNQKYLILIYFLLQSMTVFAHDQVVSEVFLKKMGKKMETLLRDSIEAQVFIEEDLFPALGVLEKAQIKWIPTLDLMPGLFEKSGRPLLTLSSNLSFQATTKDKVAIALEIIFHIKRQLEVSSLPLPLARIELFSRKFSSLLIEELDSCSLSIYPLPEKIPVDEKNEFLTDFIAQVNRKNYFYDSKWGNIVAVLDTKEYTDAECGGKNRNLINIKIKMINLKQLTSTIILDETGTSCGYSQDHISDVFRKIRKKLKKNLNECNIAFKNN